MPKTSPLVTIVIPVYNYAQWVAEAIRSVQAQTLTNFECFIVDDGSTDNSVDVITEVIANDKRFTLLQKTNGGVANARNYGIEHGTAPFCLCLDADDALGSTEYLKTLVSIIEIDRALGVVFTSLRVMNENSELAPANSAWPDGWDFDLQARGRNQVPTCALFRREAWKRAGGYRTEYEPAEDARLWTTIGALGYRAEHVVRDGWFLYRDHANSLSKTRPQPNWSQFAWSVDNQRPFASQGRASKGSFPVRNYDTPLVSVIIPVGKGHENLVRRALDSIDAQTVREWECLVVNDTGQALKRLPTWVKVHATPKAASGAAAARNVGLHAARGQMVTFLDADDYLHPLYLEKTIAAYRRSGRYIYTDWLALNKEGGAEVHTAENYDPRAIFTKASIHSINVLMRRKDALAVGGFDEDMPTWEDPDFFMKLAAAGVCGERLPEPLIAYDYRTGTLREKALTMEKELKATLYRKHQRWIEGIEQVCCIDHAIKAQRTTVQNNPTFAEYAKNGNAHPEFGRMVYIRYEGVGGKEVIGSISRQRYQYRDKYEEFNVWERDVDAEPDVFVRMAVEDTIEATPMPKEPELV
jgi:glycosyltransferase involved in cell wall biosynthesis